MSKHFNELLELLSKIHEKEPNQRIYDIIKNASLLTQPSVHKNDWKYITNDDIYFALKKYYESKYMPRIKPKSNFELVKEFHAAFEVDRPGITPDELATLRSKLIAEEVNELAYEMEMYTLDKVKFAKELADLLYVTYGTAVSYGIDIDSVFCAVHESNMSKLDKDGKPIYRADGKVLKSDLYKEPNLSFIDGNK